MNVWSISEEHRARAARAHRGHGLTGFVNILPAQGLFQIRWRWKTERGWHYGSTRTREEAEAAKKAALAAIANGEEPVLPHVEDRRTHAERGAAGAHKRWANREPWSAYVTPAAKSTRWNIRWARRGGKYHQGSVDSREEAEEILAVVLAALRAGIEPPALPTGRASRQIETTFRAPDEIAARRAEIKRQLENPERCEVCQMLKPCSPCLPELRAAMRAARRAAE